MLAVVECSECGDSLCGPCREAHAKTRVTKGHTVTEVAQPVIHHPRSAARDRREIRVPIVQSNIGARLQLSGCRKDAAEGREVKGESEGYLVRIYR